MKTVQYFSEDYLERCSKMSCDEIVSFLDDYRRLHARQSTKSKLISIKVPEDLLGAFKAKSKIAGIPYQTQIKKLMNVWLLEEDLE